MAPLSTAFIVPDLRGGGAQSVMLSLASAIDRARFEPSLVVLGETKTFQERIPGTVPLIIGGHARLRNSIPWLVRHLRHAKPDIVISVMGYLNLTLLALRPLLPRKTRIVVREANVLDATANELPYPLNGRYLYRRLYPCAAAVVAPSDAIAEQLRKTIPAARTPITVIPNPVDTQRLRSAATSPKRMEGKGLRLVSAGRLTHQKGYDRLIEIALQLPVDAKTDIFGNGPDADDLKQRISSHGLIQRVVIHDFTTELAAWMAGADAFVLPSRWEGLPNVVLESLAVGTPVIASDQAAVTQLATEAEPGAVTVATMDQSFVDAIGRIVPAPISPPVLRPSLLPARYQLAEVGAAWDELLADITQIDNPTPNPNPAPVSNVDSALTTKH